MAQRAKCWLGKCGPWVSRTHTKPGRVACVCNPRTHTVRGGREKNPSTCGPPSLADTAASNRDCLHQHMHLNICTVAYAHAYTHECSHTHIQEHTLIQTHTKNTFVVHDKGEPMWLQMAASTTDQQESHLSDAVWHPFKHLHLLKRRQSCIHGENPEVFLHPRASQRPCLLDQHGHNRFHFFLNAEPEAREAGHGFTLQEQTLAHGL